MSEAIRVRVRVAPRASRDTVLGTHHYPDGEALKIALSAPPFDFATNAALKKFLAKQLGVAKSAITIVSGEKGRDKVLEIAGVDTDAIAALTR